jgi:serine/threonine protein kinase
MSGLAERTYFRFSLSLGRLLRAGTYSKTRITRENGELQVRKRRLRHAPLLIWMGGGLLRMLDTGVRVLSQRDWEAREDRLYRSLYGASVPVQADRTLCLPPLAGATLASLLESRTIDEPVRREAIRLAVVALADVHRRGFTHGDAMAENVMIDLDAGVARWFDFETMHDPDRPIAWGRADDMRALLATSLLRTPPDRLAETLDLIVAHYADDDVIRLVAARFTSVLQRPLALHLGQAPLALSSFTEIARLLSERSVPGGSHP